MQKNKIKKILLWIRDFLIVWAIAFLFVTFIAQTANVHGSSMANTLHNGELVVVDKITPKFVGYERGDIVVAWSDEYKEFLIKRVIGLPGETISMDENGVVYINGVQYSENYAVHKNGEERFLGDFENGEIYIPENFYFLMGDNRENSGDSRVLGPFSKKEIKGKAFCRFWPVKKATKLC